jgi:acyl carrier protein
MSEKEKVVKELKQILTEDLFVSIPENEIKLEDSLANDLGVDSVGFVELTMILEEKYGIPISSEETTPENFRNLDRLSNFIVSKTAARVAESPR